MSELYDFYCNNNAHYFPFKPEVAYKMKAVWEQCENDEADNRSLITGNSDGP